MARQYNTIKVRGKLTHVTKEPVSNILQERLIQECLKKTYPEAYKLLKIYVFERKVFRGKL